MSNTAMVETYKKLSKLELSSIALSTGEKLGYLLEGNFVSKEIFENTINTLVDANKKTELAVIVSELGSKPNPHIFDKITLEGYLKNFGASIKKSLEHMETKSDTQILSLAQILAKVQTDSIAQTQSLTLIQNQTQTEAIAQAHAQAQAQTILDDLSLKLTAMSKPSSIVASSSLISPLVTSSILAPPFVAPSTLTSSVITTSVGTTPVVNTLITPTAVSSPAWLNPTKLQSQTTFSGKENENVEDWLSLLEVYFKVSRIPIAEWILVAATYLRESALKLYIGKSSTPIVSTWKLFSDFLKDNYSTKNYKNILLEKLKYIRQRGLLRTYIDQFMELANQLDDETLSEKTKTLFFISNLSPELKKHTGMSDPKTLEEAIKTARNLDAWNSSNTDIPQINQTNRTHNFNAKRNIKICSHCKKSGQEIENCHI